MKIYFFPGLGADSSLAKFHPIPGHEVHWIQWPKKFIPNWDDLLSKVIQENEIEPNSVFVGISFGGLVAQYLSQKIPVKKVILIGSFNSMYNVILMFRVLLLFVPLIPQTCFRIVWLPKIVVKYFFGIRKEEHLKLFFEMESNRNCKQIKVFLRLILLMEENRFEGKRVFKIHGSRDRILPVFKQKVDTKIEGGGHLISMTHSEIINAEILKVISE